MKTTKDHGYPPGACLQCIRDYAGCTKHRTEDREREKRQSAAIRSANAAHREQEIATICLRYELESDEGGTAQEKARRIIDESTTTTK